MTETVGQELIEFTEFAIEHVANLRKTAAELSAERDALQARIDEMNKSLEAANTKIASTSSKASLPSARVEQIAQLLTTSGLVKTSSDKLHSDIQKNPEKLLDLFEQFITSDPSEGDLTTLKSASYDEEPDNVNLWRAAAK